MCETSVPNATTMTVLQSRCMVVKGLWNWIKSSESWDVEEEEWNWKEKKRALW